MSTHQHIQFLCFLYALFLDHVWVNISGFLGSPSQPTSIWLPSRVAERPLRTGLGTTSWRCWKLAWRRISLLRYGIRFIWMLFCMVKGCCWCLVDGYREWKDTYVCWHVPNQSCDWYRWIYFSLSWAKILMDILQSCLANPLWAGKRKTRKGIKSNQHKPAQTTEPSEC